MFRVASKASLRVERGNLVGVVEESFGAHNAATASRLPRHKRLAMTTSWIPNTYRYAPRDDKLRTREIIQEWRYE